MTPMDPCASHLPVLIACVNAIPGRVLECGVGFWSTPLLHVYRAKREIVSLECTKFWVDQFARYNLPGHAVRQIVAGQADPALSEPCGICFVDGFSWDRVPVIRAMGELAEVLVIHDSEESHEHIYHMHEILATFPYRRDFVHPEFMADSKAEPARTTVVSRKNDLTFLDGLFYAGCPTKPGA